MHNYFVIIGPAEDPGGRQGGQVRPRSPGPDPKKSGQKFLSRGDNSGTNVKELALWKAAGQEPKWPGYLEAGQGMGRVLTMAQNMKAYTMSDIGTYTKYKSLGRSGPAGAVHRRRLAEEFLQRHRGQPGQVPQDGTSSRPRPSRPIWYRPRGKR